MESRAFIKAAAVLIEKIEAAGNTIGTNTERDATRDALQKEVSSLMTANLNPTLPSAFRLRDVAKRAGYSIAPPVMQRLAAFENWSA